MGAIRMIGDTTFRARSWLRSAAPRFFDWSAEQRVAERQLDAMCTASMRLLVDAARDRNEAELIALRLDDVQRRCDALPFDSTEETLAYLCLHLVDRCGRVKQVLEQLLSMGELPPSQPVHGTQPRVCTLARAVKIWTSC